MSRCSQVIAYAARLESKCDWSNIDECVIWVIHNGLCHSLHVVQLYRWGYQYVENLTWVYMDANNTILTTPSDYAQKSHLTLFIFRKEGDGADFP